MLLTALTGTNSTRFEAEIITYIKSKIKLKPFTSKFIYLKFIPKINPKVRQKSVSSAH